MSRFERVAVVGAGLIGGSILLRLVERGLDVVAVEPDGATRDLLSAAGVSVRDVVPPDRDLVVVAVPLDAMETAMRGVGEAAPRALVIDVGSAKVTVADGAQAAGIGSRYVGAHPMAGTEHSGFAHATTDLLVGVTWALTHARSSTGEPHLVDVAVFLMEHFGATVVVLDEDAHDRAVALVSHAPHVLANALLEVVEGASATQPAARHLAAGSFRDGTRVAGRNSERTLNLLSENVVALGAVLDDLLATLTDYRRALAHPPTLAEHLQRVADAADYVRDPDLSWDPCPDLLGAVRESSQRAAPLLVREGPVGLEMAWA